MSEVQDGGRTLGTLSTLLLLVAVSGASCRFLSRNIDDDMAAQRAAVTRAHETYVAAINANALDTWLAVLSDDVVYLIPSRPAIVGKAKVGGWVAGYLQEATTYWTKLVQDLVVSGDWAYVRYVYAVSDTAVVADPSVDGGGTVSDSGWGFVVYHRDAAGTWRVARDGWSSDRPTR
jgi:ketosteroid isomerase-like protein